MRGTEPIGVTTTSDAKVAVTGATGFIGAHITDQLIRAGERVRVLIRDPAKLQNLPGLDVEPTVVDLLNLNALRRELTGCEVLFHVAAKVGGRPRDEVWSTNATAPPLIIQAAAAAGVRRVVLTSTASAVGPAPPGELTDETTPYRSLGFVYADSKQAGEVAALEAAEKHRVELVVTNPSYCLGAPLNRSVLSSPSTRVVANYLRGRLPSVVDAYNDFVDVQDVAIGHLLAARHGRSGERYLLSGRDLAWPEFIERVRQISGVDHPVVALPTTIERYARRKRVLGVRNPLPREAVRLMVQDWRYSRAKAERELGYQARPLDESIKRTVAWYHELIHGGRFDGAPRRSVDVLGSLVRGAHGIRLLGPICRVGGVRVV